MTVQPPQSVRRRTPVCIKGRWMRQFKDLQQGKAAIPISENYRYR